MADESNINNVGELPGPATSGGQGQTQDLQPQSGSSTFNMNLSVGQASQFTVQFDLSLPSNLPTPTAPGKYPPIFATALITWSVGGNVVNRKVPVTNGMSVSGVGEGVTVVVTDETALPDGSGIAAYPEGATYSVGITIAPGARAATPLLPYYTDSTLVGAVGQSTTVNLKIDPMIGASMVFVSVLRFTNIASPTRQPAVLTEPDVYVNQLYDGVIYDQFYPRANQWQPLVPGCDTLQIVGGSALASTDGIFYRVYLGVDG